MAKLSLSKLAQGKRSSLCFWKGEGNIVGPLVNHDDFVLRCCAYPDQMAFTHISPVIVHF